MNITPGPWTITLDDTVEGCYIIDGLAARFRAEQDAAYGDCSDEECARGDAICDQQVEEEKANARAIAQVPAMLALAQTLASLRTYPIPEADPHDAEECMNDLIAEARRIMKEIEK